MYFSKYLHCCNSTLSTFSKVKANSVSDEGLSVEKSCLPVYIYQKKREISSNNKQLLGGKIHLVTFLNEKSGFDN